MDANAFFREATLRICGSLEIETALWNTFQFLRHHIPAEKAFFHHYNPETATSVINASADADGGQTHNYQAKWPEEWHRIAMQDGLPESVILNNAEDHPLSRIMLRPFVTKGPFSVLVLRLSLSNEWIGGVTLWAPGKDRFTQEHLELFAMLRDPFAIALSNSRRYQELLAYKDRLVDDKQYLERELRKTSGGEIIGVNGGLKDVMEKVYQVAHLDSPVLLKGETGVGKEIIANAIHSGSPRRKGPFIKVNCGAIPDTLIDSELFGYEKGAFTGAVARKRGRFERAHTGTLFLDEIGELPINAQVRFLRVLQEKVIERIGGSQSIPVDIRIIAATHRDLPAMVELGEFRKDLFFRLQVFPIEIPPLRKRLDDIPSLTSHFLVKKAREIGLDYIPALEKSALAHLASYHWPGNIRELENAVERAIIVSGGNALSFSEFGLSFLSPVGREAACNEDADTSLGLDEVTRRHIKKVLKAASGKVGGSDGAAAALKINESTLRHKMRKLGIPFGRKA
jgi:formate hydrogenlyase transcriptional activator